MKFFTYLALICLCPLLSFSQDISGLWKGSLYNDSTRQTYQYEVVINKQKGKYTGFSHTWFIIDGKEYYGVKKLKVNIAKDGKVIIADDELVAHNYPVAPFKNVRQLNVLDLNDQVLHGLFVTNTTTQYREVTGQVKLKRETQPGQSDLMSYLEKSSKTTNLVVAR